MIIWLASYPRSGSTLLRTLVYQTMGLGSYSDELGEIPITDAAYYYEHLTIPDDRWDQFYRDATASPNTYLVKTHLPPRDSQPAIYVLRDGRNALTSYAHFHRDMQEGSEVSLLDLVLGIDYYGTWAEHHRVWMARPGSMLAISYESMMQSPEMLLPQIADFIGFAGEPRSWKNPFHILQASFPKFFRRANVEWKGDPEWTPLVNGVFFHLQGEAMANCGYVTSEAVEEAVQTVPAEVMGIADCAYRLRQRERALQVTADQRHAVIETLQATCTERLAIIQALNGLVDVRQAALESMRTVCEEKQAGIDLLKAACDERLALINRLKAICDERQEVIDDLKRICDERQTVIEGLTPATGRQETSPGQTSTMPPGAAWGETALLREPPPHLVSPDVRECWFYHSLDLPVSGPQRGQWDLRGRFDDYVQNIDLKGKSVLDVGTASGFLSFEAAKRGARVVSFDADHAQRWNRLSPATGHSAASQAAWEAEAETALNRMKQGYWLARSEFRAETAVLYGDVYQLSPETAGRFDVVIVGQIIVHLSDLIRALTAIASCCADRLVVAEGMVDDPRPVSVLLPDPHHVEDHRSLWSHSREVYVRILDILGLKLERAGTATYLSTVTGRVAITTLVFVRR